MFVGVGVGLTLAILCALHNPAAPACTAATYADAVTVQRAADQDNQRGSDALSYSAQSLQPFRAAVWPQPLGQTALSEPFAACATDRQAYGSVSRL